MAAKKSGDFVLESRHLVGLFMLLVVIFGVVFTLGYLLGRSQSDSKMRVAVGKTADPDMPAAPPSEFKTKSKPDHEDAAPKKKSPDWDFYHAAEPKTAEDRLQPASKAFDATPVPVQPKRILPAPQAGPPKTVDAKPLPAPTNSPLVAKGAIMLQVAAVTGQGDALALAQVLQRKKFHAVVITPGADKFYRVQVGPYADDRAAALARHELEANGFKSIIKR